MGEIGSRHSPLRDVAIRRLRADETSGISDLLKIYDEAIHPSERKPPDTVKAMAENSDYLVLGAFVLEKLVGFLVAHISRGQSLSLVEYMAVGRAWQGKGIGGDLFRELLTITDNSVPILLEVDSPRFPSADHNQRTSREKFYRRLGCRKVAGLTYQLPLPGDPPPMDLMVHWPGHVSVPRATIKRWLTALYVDVYDQSASDPRVAAMIDGLPVQVPLV